VNRSAVAARGRFITVEGIEGSGKSTLVAKLAERLRESGLDVVTTREPGGTVLAEKIRELLLARGGEPMPPAAEAMLLFAARAVHVENLIRPALAAGRWVVCDRFTDASVAYQGGGRGVRRSGIESLAALAHPDLMPDMTLLLDVDPEVGLERARGRRDGGDRFEDETVAFFTRVRAAYRELARAAPARFRVIDAMLPQDDVLARALKSVDALREAPAGA
jgi:dTMP kinase